MFLIFRAATKDGQQDSPTTIPPNSTTISFNTAFENATAGAGGSLFISGMNRSDDLFMYHKRRIMGLQLGGGASTDLLGHASRLEIDIGRQALPGKDSVVSRISRSRTTIRTIIMC
jgi:hypothetical protein